MSLDSLLFKRDALFRWMKLVLTALSSTLSRLAKFSVLGIRRIFLTTILIASFFSLLCAVRVLSLRIFFFADLIIGIVFQ